MGLRPSLVPYKRRGVVLVIALVAVAAGNGDTLFETGPGGHGGWSAVAAPVSVPDARNDVCPNYVR